MTTTQTPDNTNDQRQLIAARATEIAGAVSDLALTVDSHATDLDLPALYEIAEWCDILRRTVSVLKDVVEAAMVSQVPKDTKVTHWTSHTGQGYRTEVKYRATRTQVQRDDLLRAVKATARTTNPTTGEIVPDYQTMVKTLEDVYRFEPRWTGIKALGIDPDEYCVAKYEAQVTTTPEQDQQQETDQ